MRSDLPDVKVHFHSLLDIMFRWLVDSRASRWALTATCLSSYLDIVILTMWKAQATMKNLDEESGEQSSIAIANFVVFFHPTPIRCIVNHSLLSRS